MISCLASRAVPLVGTSRSIEICHNCDGYGEVEIVQGGISMVDICPVCDGKGVIPIG